MEAIFVELNRKEMKMKKYLIPLLISTALATTCFAEIPKDAMRIAKNAYIFLDSIVPDFNNLTVDAWFGYVDFKSDSRGDALVRQAQSFKARGRFYCERQEWQVTNSVYYSKTNFEGKILFHATNPSDIGPLVPGSPLYKTVKILCDPILRPKN